MARSQPYQSLIFRCLHSAQGVLAILAMATGYWLLNTWDPRFMHLPLPAASGNSIDFHEEVGGLFMGAIALFILYSLTAGRRRLLQLKTWKKLLSWGKPGSWYSLHQLINTGLLIMAVLAVISGDELSGGALMAGNVTSLAYNLHVFAWLGMVVLMVGHLLLSVKVGGVPLLLSVVSLKVRPKDSPLRWPQHWQQLADKFLHRVSRYRR